MIPYSTQCIEPDDIESVTRALRSSHLTQGALTEEFESALCAKAQTKYAISFNSATSALYALYGAYILLHYPQRERDFHAQDLTCISSISRRDCAPNAPHLSQDSKISHALESSAQAEPICFVTTPISFVATTNMMLLWGITPIFCEVKDDGNIDERALESLLATHPQRERIRAIVSVDYAGKSVELDTLQALAARHRLTLFSDSSHSFGGSYRGKPIGSHARASVFSFHALKSITTAEGGAIVTNDENLAHFARLLRSHGVEKGELWRYDCQLAGLNFRLSELGAALGLSQIHKCERFIKARNDIARFYDEAFCENPHFDTIAIEPHITSAQHLYPILLRPHLHARKDTLFRALQEWGLGVQVHYKPIYQFSLYRQILGELSLPNAERFYTAEISIPCHQSLGLDSARHIAMIVTQVCAQA